MSDKFNFVIPNEKERIRYTAMKDNKSNCYIVSFSFGSIKTSTTYMSETVKHKLASNSWVKI